MKRKFTLARSVLTIAAVGMVTTGVTFAALQSQNAVLAGSSISSASASLQIGATPTSLAASMPGFSFSNVEPGGAAMPANGNSFYLKNDGTTALELKLTTNAFTFPSGVDISKVWLVLTAPDTTTQRLALSTLYDSNTSSGSGTPVDLHWSLPPGTTTLYKAQISMDATAITSSTVNSIALNNIDFIFSGSSLAAS